MGASRNEAAAGPRRTGWWIAVGFVISVAALAAALIYRASNERCWELADAGRLIACAPVLPAWATLGLGIVAIAVGVMLWRWLKQARPAR